MNKLICGIGESSITADSIRIQAYPFEPSVVYPEKEVVPEEIHGISTDYGQGKLYLGKDIVFISRTNIEALHRFAQVHQIPLIPSTYNWDLLLEPYLDTEFTSASTQKTMDQLIQQGIPLEEIKQIREEVGQAMLHYNFSTMLWEWINLNLADVLAAMRAMYNVSAFRDFYYRAMEIERRGNPNISK